MAPNKFLAKLASVEAKPVATPRGVEPGPGVVVVEADAVQAFLDPLPVERLWGVGPVTLDKLHAIGVRRVADLVSIDGSALITALGRSQAEHLVRLARGWDERAVEPEREAKSIGHEETFETNKYESAELRRELVRLADAVAQRLRSSDVGARTLTLKLRFDTGFQTITRSVTSTEPIDLAPEIVAALGPLLDAVDPSPGVRLLGVAGSNLGPVTRQLTLDDVSGHGPDWTAATGALDEIRRRFGTSAIGPASALEDGRLRVVRQGEQQWGPQAERRPRGTEGAGPSGPSEKVTENLCTALRNGGERAMMAPCLFPRMSNASFARSSSSSNRTLRSPSAAIGCRDDVRSC